MGRYFFPDSIKKKNTVQFDRLKLYTACWKAFFFTITLSIGTIIIINESSWVFSPELYCKGWPNHEMRYYFNFNRVHWLKYIIYSKRVGISMPYV